jgi:hypothetical protein
LRSRKQFPTKLSYRTPFAAFALNLQSTMCKELNWSPSVAAEALCAAEKSIVERWQELCDTDDMMIAVFTRRRGLMGKEGRHYRSDAKAMRRAKSCHI